MPIALLALTAELLALSALGCKIPCYNQVREEVLQTSILDYWRHGSVS